MARVEHDTGTHEGEGIRFQYQLSDTPEITNLRVVDSTGATVFEQAGEAREGLFTFDWNGTDSLGAPAPTGNYRLVVDARGAENSSIPATVFVEDEIQAVDGITGDLSIGGSNFEQNDLLRLIARGN